MKCKFSSILNTQGFTIIEALIGGAIILGAAAALSVSLLIISSSREKSRMYAQAISIETDLIAALQTPDTFTSIRGELAEGNIPEKFNIRYNNRTLATLGSPTNFDINGNICPILGTNRCLLQTQVDIQCSNAASTYNVCRSAYRISFANGQLASLGSPPTDGGGTFTVTDYSIPISTDSYVRPPVFSCNQEHAVIRGFNRVTGEMTCIDLPQASCPTGTLAKNLVLTNNQLGLRCVTPNKINCPANYVLQTFSPASLDPSNNVSGTCVFISKKSVPWKNPPQSKSVSVSGNFCPPQHYRARITSCSAQVTSQTYGSCPNISCNCRTVCTPCPPQSPPSCQPTCNFVCDSCPPPVRNPAPANLGSTTSSASGTSASCSINTSGQRCGSSWTGTVKMTGTCELIDPETTVAK